MPSPPVFSFFGRFRARPAVETIIPQRTFADVILPPATRQTLDDALAQVHNHVLIFGRWGLGERHATGLGLAFNFAAPRAPERRSVPKPSRTRSEAVLLFDEADPIAARRSVGVAFPHQREANTTVNVLLRELEGFNGVVIFATNLAANFDPAFARAPTSAWQVAATSRTRCSRPSRWPQQNRDPMSPSASINATSSARWRRCYRPSQ